jgi:hypothetical protein
MEKIYTWTPQALMFPRVRSQEYKAIVIKKEGDAPMFPSDGARPGRDRHISQVPKWRPYEQV